MSGGEEINPGHHLAEARRLLERAETFDDSDRADLPRQPGDYRLERRATDVTAAHCHLMIAEMMQRPGLGGWTPIGGGRWWHAE